MVSLTLVFLGTSSAVPTPSRALSGLAIQRGAEVLLFDAGEGAQRQMIAAKLGLGRPMRIFVTHLHGDHCVGVLGLLQSMAMVSRERPLEVYGPRGIGRFVRGNQRYLGFGLTFPLRIHEVAPGMVVTTGEYTVEAAPAAHSIHALAYRLTEASRPGKFHPQRAQRLGVPEGRLWSKLQDGQRVRVGRRWVLPHQVLGPPRPGRKIGISGDTRPTPALARFFHGCDVLVFDSTYARMHARQAREHFHSTAGGAARLARQAGVGLLVLTHFSARYENSTDLVREAARIHPNVIAARDLLTLDVPYRTTSAARKPGGR